MGKGTGMLDKPKAMWVWMLIHRKKVVPVLIMAMLVVAGSTFYFGLQVNDGSLGDSTDGEQPSPGFQEYGFVNAFNVDQNWYDDDYVGIDQGNIVLLMEDFRSGLVWNEFMQISYIQEGLTKAGFVNGFDPDERGFIRDWLVIGPFGSSEEEAFQTDYIGETTISVSPKASDVAGGKTWMEHHSAFGEPTSNYIDLSRIFQPNENVGAYAFVTVVSDRDRTVDLRVGSDDSIKIWINNELVHSNQVARAADEDQDIIQNVLLQEGSNKVLVKVCNTWGEWGFYLRFTNPTSVSVPQLSLGWDELRSGEGGVSLTWDDLSQEDKDFLDQVEQAAFWFFWNEANPETGLIPDRATNDDVSSIASVGFGLSAICVAESRGWVTYEQAYNRVLTTLNSFYDDPSDPNDLCVQGSHGFFYHFVNMESGVREWGSEISLIDTSLLIAGVLHAGQHFKWTEIEALADEIYRAVEWDWLQSGDLLKVTPDGGRKTGYDEYILSYILALGSPTHPIPASSWDAYASGYGWVDYGGVKFLTPGGDFKPLAYLYQFPACWIDFKEKHDDYANYWQNAIAALKANRQYCLDQSANYSYGSLWGWTACDGPNGYQGYGDPFNGTIAPSAVAASIPFIPEYAIPTLKSTYDSYYTQIWK